MTATVAYGTTKIDYSIIFRERKTMAIEVHPNCDVFVIAPIDSPIDIIEEKILKRASWIAKQVRFYSGATTNIYQNEWVSGESIHYLGRQYRLKISVGESLIKLQGRYLFVQVSDITDKAKIEVLVKKWYLKHAILKFNERLNLFKNIIERENLFVNTLKIRKINKRWGSCTKEGNIILNSDLIKLPIYCIDYVLIHEICHLKHHNHSPAFWNMLTKYCPDWVKLKDKLERF